MLTFHELTEILDRSPVIAAIHDADFEAALASPCEVLFHLKASILTVSQRVEEAHRTKDKIHAQSLFLIAHGICVKNHLGKFIG